MTDGRPPDALPDAGIPAVDKVLETSLYVEDLDTSEQFYQRLFGFERLVGDARVRALAVPGGQVLLLFRKSASVAAEIPGGLIPGHDGTGQLHVAFAIPRESLSAWEERLRDSGIAIESTVQWPRGGSSLYFRDPDGHLVELVTPGCWANY